MKIRNFGAFLGFLTVFLVAGLEGCTGKKGGAQSQDNTLRLPMIADAKTMDPQFVEELYSHYATSLAYESLLDYNYLKRDPHELIPRLAEAMPEVSKDGLTYTFKIKKGVRFMDHPSFPNGKGREVTAQDFIYTFLRVADPRTNSPGFWLFDGHIVGINEWREVQKKLDKTNFEAPPAGFSAPDPYTLVIKVTRKFPQLLYVMAMPQTHVVPREAVEKLGKDFVGTTVGTGPYKLVSWNRNSKLVFERNPNWRGEKYPTAGDPGDAEAGFLADAGKPYPFADRVEYYVYVESQPMWLNFLSGNLDQSAIPKDSYKQAITAGELSADLKTKGISLRKSAEPDTTYIAFNLEDPVIKKLGPDFRKAVSLANNNKESIELFYNNRAVQAKTPLPPGIPGYEENFPNPYADFNVEKAKEYLAKAGYPGGKGLPELTFDTNQGTDARQLAEKFQSDMAKIGIKMRINVNQFAELSEKLNKGKAQMWGIAWIADYPDAENFMQLLYGPNKSPAPNAANFDNPEYNKLYVQMAGMADSPERRKIIHRMNEIFVENMPWVVGAHRIVYSLTQPWLKNYKPGFMGGSAAPYIRVDRGGPAAGQAEAKK